MKASIYAPRIRRIDHVKSSRLGIQPEAIFIPVRDSLLMITVSITPVLVPNSSEHSDHG